MARKSPCQYCKQRRRKCERVCETEPCQRCVQMNRKCIPQGGSVKSQSSDEEEHVVDSLELVSLYQQVRDLENQLQSLELGLQNEGSAIVKKEPHWDIEFVNGQLRLKSKIQSLEEMLLYGQSVIRYLSPFGNTFHTNALMFERGNTSCIQATMLLFSKFEDPMNAVSRVAIYKDITQQFSIGFTQSLHPSAFVERLVNNYFSCFNEVIPILHEPSYREHFNALKDPLKDMVTLAVCTTCAIQSCKHSIFNAKEKRCVGEYFFNACMDLLVDKFDDPDCALESVLAINLLQVFMVTTLRLNESKKWASIAFLLCTNLRNENQGSPKLELALELPKKQRIKNSMIHRNSVLSECFLAVIDFILNNRYEHIHNTTASFDILPDESPKVKDLLEILNVVLELATHPSFIVVITQARTVTAGGVAELSFKDIIRYEEYVIDWWRKLPDHLKLCADPLQLTKEIIEKTTDYRKLMVACYIHTITLAVQGCFILPKPDQELESVYDVVRGRAIQLAMHSADMCLLLVRRIDQLEVLCYSPAELLIHSIDSLMTLVQVQDESLARAAKMKMKDYMYEVSKRIPPDHQVSPSASPYSIISFDPQRSVPSIIELYKTYPLPGEALAFDIIRSTVESNIKRNKSAAVDPLQLFNWNY